MHHEFPERFMTPRLLVRPVRTDDLGALVERRNDPDVAELQAWETPWPAELGRQMIDGMLSATGPRDEHWWMLTIANRDDTTIYGDIVFRPTWDGRSVEIGYTLGREHWGRGFASEAVGALIDLLFGDPRTTRISAMLHPDNHASAMVLERNGFEFEGRTSLSYWVGDDNSDDLLYGLTRGGWEAWRNRPISSPDDIRLVEITPETSRPVRRLAVHRSQERFVSSVAKSFGDALYPDVIDDAPVAPWLRAVEADGEPVGFVMVALTTEHHTEPYLWRFMIDRRHQRRGIGDRVLTAVVDQCRTWGDHSLLVSWVEGKGSPRRFYERLGFVPTGTFVDGETEARRVIV